VQQLVRVPRKEHSEKPREVAHAIERMFPTQERIELFARRKVKGWEVWGLDVFPEAVELARSSDLQPQGHTFLTTEDVLASDSSG
jgi:N6-adenosine-specific RNA methylase IME4